MPENEEEKPIDIQAQQKKRGWGHEKGWAWWAIDKLDALCTHRRTIVVREFFGRRVKAVQCRYCKRRAIIFRSRRNAPRKSARPDVVLPPYKPWRLKP